MGYGACSVGVLLRTACDMEPRNQRWIHGVLRGKGWTFVIAVSSHSIRGIIMQNG